MPRFADVVESTVETLSRNPRAKVDEERVIQASQLVRFLPNISRIVKAATLDWRIRGRAY